jgi:excisionase family DNA binding protein
MAWNLVEQIRAHEGLITVPEAAAMLGLSQVTVKRMIYREEIPRARFSTRSGRGTALRIDPKTWEHVILKSDRMMREAVRHG